MKGDDTGAELRALQAQLVPAPMAPGQLVRADGRCGEAALGLVGQLLATTSGVPQGELAAPRALGLGDSNTGIGMPMPVVRCFTAPKSTASSGAAASDPSH